MSGYVRIHRALLGHPAFRNESETMAFAWLVVKAAWKATRVRYKGHSITLTRGQVAISQRDMAAAFDRDKAWIERLWKRLKSEAMIETSVEAGVAVITICNYDAYQFDVEECEAPREARGKADNEAGARQRRGTEQGKEKDNNTPLPPKGGSGSVDLPDWVPRPAWAGFEAMRKQIKKPLSERGRELAIVKLGELRDQGNDPGGVLDQSTLNSWQGLFPLKGDQRPQRTVEHADFLDHRIAQRKQREEWEQQRAAGGR